MKQQKVTVRGFQPAPGSVFLLGMPPDCQKTLAARCAGYRGSYTPSVSPETKP